MAHGVSVLRHVFGRSQYNGSFKPTQKLANGIPQLQGSRDFSRFDGHVSGIGSKSTDLWYELLERDDGTNVILVESRIVNLDTTVKGGLTRRFLNKNHGMVPIVSMAVWPGEYAKDKEKYSVDVRELHDGNRGTAHFALDFQLTREDHKKILGTLIDTPVLINDMLLNLPVTHRGEKINLYDAFMLYDRNGVEAPSLEQVLEQTKDGESLVEAGLPTFKVKFRKA